MKPTRQDWGWGAGMHHERRATARGNGTEEGAAAATPTGRYRARPAVRARTGCDLFATTSSQPTVAEKRAITQAATTQPRLSYSTKACHRRLLYRMRHDIYHALPRDGKLWHDTGGNTHPPLAGRAELGEPAGRPGPLLLYCRLPPTPHGPPPRSGD